MTIFTCFGRSEPKPTPAPSLFDSMEGFEISRALGISHLQSQLNKPRACRTTLIEGDAMCGIFCALSPGQPVQPSQDILDRLKCRGPDSNHTLHVENGSSSCSVTLCSTVLSLRGSDTTDQPHQDPEGKYLLCWNGEAWSIDGQSSIQDDTASVHALLRASLEAADRLEPEVSCIRRAEVITGALCRVAGPYAFVFMDRKKGHLYFGRDFLGRRSLCWRITDEGCFILCSISDGLASHQWREVEADGVFFLDLQELTGLSSAEFTRNRELGLTIPLTKCVPHYYIGKCSSVIPRLSLNKKIPSSSPHLDESSSSVAHLDSLLRKSLALRVLNVPDPPVLEPDSTIIKIAILFSGGLDCTVLARLCHDLLPLEQSIDLINVAFENPRIHSKLSRGAEEAYELCPDRITGRSSHAELQDACPNRLFRFVAVNVPYSETQQHRETVISLMHPHNTEMDLSISHALYSAARGAGVIADSATEGSTKAYTTPARVLLSGLGADELFGGYTRHATAFRRASFSGLIDELELDVSRLGKRNLGRDDRVISHWGKEARFPFLDEAVVAWAVNAAVHEKCGFGEEVVVEGKAGSDVLEPEKKVLRCLARKLGMRGVAKEKKRAIQFGARTAKMETGKTKGTTLLS